MRGYFQICNGIYWVALTIWISAIFSTGVAAVGVFSTLPQLGIRAERLDAAFAGDTATQGRVVGGMIMEPIFTATDLVQAAAAVFAAVALVLQLTLFRMRWRSPANLIRTVCVAAALLLVVIHMFVFAPRMNRELRASWREAEAGNVERWERHRLSFEADHVIANRLFNVRFVLLLVAITASAAALTPAVHVQPRGNEGKIAG